MLRTLHRWQHKFLSVFFDMPEDMEPLKTPPWQNRPLQNHPLPNRPLPAAHAKQHQPRVLKEWQNSIRNFVERYIAQK